MVTGDSSFIIYNPKFVYKMERSTNEVIKVHQNHLICQFIIHFMS